MYTVQYDYIFLYGPPFLRNWNKLIGVMHCTPLRLTGQCDVQNGDWLGGVMHIAEIVSTEWCILRTVLRCVFLTPEKFGTIDSAVWCTPRSLTYLTADRHCNVHSLHEAAPVAASEKNEMAGWESLFSHTGRLLQPLLTWGKRTRRPQWWKACTVPKIIDFLRYNMKCIGGSVILRGKFHVVSGFPLHFKLYLGNFDCFSNSVGGGHVTGSPINKPVADGEKKKSAKPTV